jgi:predicted AlkP superfamily pyrophosphatase or phosphodiesterase
MDALPKWVKQFNEKRIPAKYLSSDWNTLFPISQYTESTPDSVPYEGTFKGETAPVFPHKLPLLKSKNYELIKSTPFGNTITKDFAIEAIKQENMGKGAATDFLAISFSSTDYVGHRFGPNSVESEDTYLRLDKDLADLLSFLDTWVGKENVLVFLTADHGVAPVPAFAQQHNIPAGLNNDAALMQLAGLLLQRQFNDTSLIIKYSNQQFFLNHTEMESAGITEQKIYDAIKPTFLSMAGIRDVILTDNLQQSTLPAPFIDLLRNSIYPKRCGDIMVVYDPYWFAGGDKGTTHGAIFSYDTHVPLLWYGWSIKQGSGSELVHMTDVAPTIADFLRIQEPNGNVGTPIQGLK